MRIQAQINLILSFKKNLEFFILHFNIFNIGFSEKQNGTLFSLSINTAKMKAQKAIGQW